MSTKLTLTLDEKVIYRAKNYAKKNNISLSKLVEFYFRKLGKDSLKSFSLPPLTKKLVGSAELKTTESDKEMLSNALAKKYLS